MDKLNQQQIDFLVELGKKMNAQNNRSTANVLFMIEEEVKVPRHPNWGYEERERSEYYTNEDLCEACQKLAEDGEEVPDQCDECSDDCFNHYNLERQTVDTAGVFFTAEACDEHIRLNGHHYTKPKSYGVSAWRNPEMQGVQEILSILGSADGKIQHNYR